MLILFFVLIVSQSAFCLLGKLKKQGLLSVSAISVRVEMT